VDCFVARGIRGSVYLLDANGQDCTDPRSDVAEARRTKDRDQRSPWGSNGLTVLVGHANCGPHKHHAHSPVHLPTPTLHPGVETSRCVLTAHSGPGLFGSYGMILILFVYM
jgi:hypothetical protein